MVKINKYNDIIEIIPQEDMVFTVSSDICNKIKEQLIGVTVKQIVLNMEKMKCIDSSGIGVVIHIINNYNADIIVVNMNSIIKKVLYMTGVDSFFTESYDIDELLGKRLKDK